MKILFILPLLFLKLLAEETHKQKEFNYNFQQNDYQIKFERIDILRYNKDYFSKGVMTTRKFNRTCAVTNITFELKVDVGNDFDIIIQAYKFMSNEYRYFPLRFAVNTCKALSANMIGSGKMYGCGNFTGCPFVKNKVYHICNWNPDAEKFPPLIPNGDYKIELQGIHSQQEIGVAELYGSVRRPIKFPTLK